MTSTGKAEMTYHGKMMNIQAPPASLIVGSVSAYQTGHKEARHAAAEIANGADAEITRLRARNEKLEGAARFLADIAEQNTDDGRAWDKAISDVRAALEDGE